MKEYSVVMALVDFVPVVFFIIGAAVLRHSFYQKMGRIAFSLFACGTLNIALAGLLKALYKLLYAMGVCDFEALSALFMPLQAIGFLLAGLAVITQVCRKPKAGTAMVVAAPPLFNGLYVFIGTMVAGCAAMMLGLSALAKRAKKHGASVLFIIVFICNLGMGFLSSRDFDQAIFNWIAQGVNVVGQGCFLIAALMYHRAKPAAETPAEEVPAAEETVLSAEETVSPEV